ncbi:MAG: hypothetical protein ABW087_20005 [Candidatus Thiodiazotropha sp.]
MRLHRICGVRFRSHLRSYARAYAYRGLTAFASLSMAVSDRSKQVSQVPKRQRPRRKKPARRRPRKSVNAVRRRHWLHRKRSMPLLPGQLPRSNRIRQMTLPYLPLPLAVSVSIGAVLRNV